MQKLAKGFSIKYNPYFHIPFLVWIVVGGILISIFDKQSLFAAGNIHYTEVTDVLMYYITFIGQPEVIIPSLVFIMLLPAFRNSWYFATASLVNLSPLAVQQWLKRVFHYPRPLRYFQDAPWMHHLPHWPSPEQDSFPSGHSQGAFSFFCFLSLLMPVRYKKLGILFFSLALLVCYSRIYLAAHFFEDVYTGSIIGGVMTTLLYSIIDYVKTKREHRKNAKLS